MSTTIYYKKELIEIWEFLKFLVPIKKNSSLHIIEHIYFLDDKYYHVFWGVGDISEIPGSISITDSEIF